MVDEFSPAEWRTIRATLDADPTRYGLPQRVNGSVLLASFNIRKLGNPDNRSDETWEFLAEICRTFDLISVQEILDNLDGLRRIMSLLGREFSLVVSDQTGAFPGEGGSGERLGFIYRHSVVERREVASDLSYDRTKILNTFIDNYDGFKTAIDEYLVKLDEYGTGVRRSRPYIKLPTFLTFIRQPYCVAFQIAGHPDKDPYEIMAVNAHLNFGHYISDRRQAFEGLMDWLNGRAMSNNRAYFPNFILMGDLNLDFNSPTRDRAFLEEHIKSFNDNAGEEVNVYFPFIDPHPTRTEVFRTNARITETYDQIGLFSHDLRLPNFEDNAVMGQNRRGPDYGVFEFVDLFSEALNGGISYNALDVDVRKEFVKRFQFEVSDHMPLWIRLPLPGFER